jgi:hypothetical protein
MPGTDEEARRGKNDLERLELDVHDVGALSRSGPQAAPSGYHGAARR